MPRYCGIGKSRPKKKQKVSNIGKDCEEFANDDRGENIEISAINSQSDEFEYEDNDELDFNSTANNCYFLKNPNVGFDSYHELSKATQRAVKHACNRVKH
eukprot:14684446-Ditylum_brightwellii.AAC.1